MAKRYVEICDYCKGENELDCSITIKSATKKVGRKYDLCSRCREYLENILVGTKPPSPPREDVPVKRRGTSENRNPREDDPNILELPDGTTRDIPESRISAVLTEDTPHSPLEDNQVSLGKKPDGSVCIHMNKTRPSLSEGQKKITVTCKDCGATLPYKSLAQRQKELDGK